MAERVFAMPDLGEGLEDGEIVDWLVAEGDDVDARPAARRGGDREGDRRDPLADAAGASLRCTAPPARPSRSARRW